MAFLLALLMLSNPAHGGEDIENAQKRIIELERQMQLMAEQLKAVQDQLTRSKDVVVPVAATLKLRWHMGQLSSKVNMSMQILMALTSTAICLRGMPVCNGW